MRSVLLLVAAVLSLTGTADALAEPVQEFGFTIHDVRPDGRYAVTFSSNSYDTTGEPPPILVTNYVRFAAGISFRPEFLRRSVLCDAELLRDTLRELPEPRVHYGDQLRRLPATYRRLRPRLSAAQARNMRTRIAARSATGPVIRAVRETAGVRRPRPRRRTGRRTCAGPWSGAASLPRSCSSCSASVRSSSASRAARR